MVRSISKGTLLAIVFGIVILAIIIYQTMGLRQVECEVCMELDGRTKCVKVRGENNQQAIQTAKDNACSFITSGRSESVRCNQSAPAKVECKHL
jgi:hypothetical protein